MLLPEGELARRANKNKVDWPAAVFYAAAEGQQFTNVEIITLKQHCVDLLIPRAIEYCAEQNIRGNQDAMIKAYFLNRTDPFAVRECVDVHVSDYFKKTFITIAVNVDKIDDEAVDYAVDLLQKIDSFDKNGYEQFGKLYTFYPKDLV